MPGIPFLDSNTSYTFAKFLDFFIKAGGPMFALFSAGVLYADFKHWKPENGWAKLLKTVLHVIIFGLTFFCIIYNIDGRYTENELGEYGNTSYYYFGGEKNGVRFGFGKVFDSEKNIRMISVAKGNKTYENVKKYTTTDDITYLSFRGTIINGKQEGYGEKFILINGEVKPSYKGYLHNDLRCGEGTEYGYYKSNGALYWKYTGEQLNDCFNGYGKYWSFNEDGSLASYYSGGYAEDKRYGYGMYLEFTDEKVSYAYRGTYWNHQRFGKGVAEYLTDKGNLLRWVGYYEDDKQSDDGAYYDEQGEFLVGELNGTLSQNEDGTTNTDQARVTELKEKWPLPDILMYGRSSEEYLCD